MSEESRIEDPIEDVEFGSFPECIPEELDPFFEPESYIDG